MMMNLLIIEDEKILLEKYKKYTEEFFDNVYTATTISNAISLLDKNDISCILSDHILPDGKGINLISKIRSKAPICSCETVK